MLLLVLAVMGVASAIIFTVAWYENNKSTSAPANSIQSEFSSPALFINAGTSPNGENQVTSASTFSGELFPISTVDCENWYYVTEWQDPVLGDSPRAKAIEYALADVASDGTYLNSEQNDTKVAFYKTSFTLYTSRDSIKVYLDPADPISVSYGAGGKDESKDLEAAVRVALIYNGSIVFIYAPEDESGTGNSGGTLTADTFYGIIGTGVDDIEEVNVLTDGTLGRYKAGGGPETGYTDGTARICTADTDGETVTVYVWLEGTDAQALVGTADSVAEENGVSVNLKFVGVLN
jgi:hypothetical protein